MPLYEFRCEPCDNTFETLIRGESDRARCPQCGNPDVVKQFSVPAVAHTGRGAGGALPVREPSGGFSGCGRPQCAGGMCAGIE